MPPKPQVFKTPDGKEFATRAEWRDYMLLNFYSFKNKINEPQPLVKLPGSIDGQTFDIGDCKGSTLVLMDHTEQVQVDQLDACKVFIPACASSIFIRNCSNCIFYVSCRQLRLRDTTNCTLYTYSQGEVHIELSTGLKFACFNGGYPDHEKHLKSANLDIKQNLWYDIYDHNDPGKTGVNWSLLPESEYEAPWFPAGPCDLAIPRTKPGAVDGSKPATDANMQSFSLQQMISDAQKLGLAPPGAPGASPVKAAPPAVPASPAVAATAAISSPAKATPSAQASPAKVATGSEENTINNLTKAFIELKAGSSLQVRQCYFTARLPHNL